MSTSGDIQAARTGSPDTGAEGTRRIRRSSRGPRKKSSLSESCSSEDELETVGLVISGAGASGRKTRSSSSTPTVGLTPKHRRAGGRRDHSASNPSSRESSVPPPSFKDDSEIGTGTDANRPANASQFQD